MYQTFYLKYFYRCSELFIYSSYKHVNMGNVKKAVHPKDSIRKHLKDIYRPLKWLSQITDIPYGSIYSIFVHESMELTQERLDKINKGLGTSFKY